MSGGADPRREAEDASEASADVGTKLQLRPNERPTRYKKPRLNRSDYVGKRTYHITLPTTQRAALFEDAELGRQFEAPLLHCADRLHFVLLAYCFMPDHLHVLLRGGEANSDLLRFVQRFKQVTGFHFKSISGDRPWRQSFFDRVLRPGADPRDVARYVFDNPVDAGFPLGHTAYPLRGGDLFRDAAPDGAEASSLHFDS